MVRSTAAALCLILLGPAGCGTAAPEPREGVPAPTLAAAREGDERIRHRVDSESGIHVYTVLPDPREARAGKLSLSAVILTGGAEAVAEFGFQTAGGTVRFRECNDLALALDGEQLPSRASRYLSGIAGGGVVTEAVVISLSAAELRAIRQAASVRYQLCETRGRLSPGDLALLRRMIALWESQAPLATR